MKVGLYKTKWYLDYNKYKNWWLKNFFCYAEIDELDLYKKNRVSKISAYIGDNKKHFVKIGTYKTMVFGLL